MTDSRWAMLCRLQVEPFDDDKWVWQRKYDGCRMRVDIDARGGVGLTARSGADKTAQFPDVVQALTVDWGKAPMTLDCELVSADGLGFQEFNQRRMNRTEDVDAVAKKLPARLVAFDCLRAWGRDGVREMPLVGRLDLLREVAPPWCWLPESSASGAALFMTAKDRGWEGVVGKRLDQPYMPNRRAWVKVKVWHEGVYKVVGWDSGKGRREGVAGSFYLEDPKTHSHAGQVGTGFNDAELRRLTELVRTSEEPVYFRVKYCEVTNDGMLRFPVYVGQERRQGQPDKNTGTPEP